jgi:hypothetical protein
MQRFNHRQKQRKWNTMERIIFNPCEHSFEIKADTATQGEKEFYRKISEGAEASILKMHIGVPLEKWRF